MRILFGLFLAVTCAYSAEIVVIQSQRINNNLDHEMEFEVNPPLGRAWVKITSRNRSFRQSLPETKRVLVPGLSFKDGEVLFSMDGGEVVCAKQKQSGRWIFRGKRIELTGNCLLEQDVIDQVVDDGFYVRHIATQRFLLIVR